MNATSEDETSAPSPAQAAEADFASKPPQHSGGNMPARSHHDDEVLSEAQVSGYWAANLRLLLGLLAVWFAISFGAGILLVGPLNTIQLGGYPLGFWFAQQGSIFVFVGLIFFYAYRMKVIERRFGVDDDE